MTGRYFLNDKTLSLHAKERIDRASVAFEDALLTGQQPQIEDMLNGMTSEERSSLLFELILLELEYRIKQGEYPAPEEYQRRFADDTGAILQAFAKFEKSERSTHRSKIEDTGSYVVPPPNAIDAPAEGDRINDRYRIIRPLGVGGFGTVLLAFDEQLSREVAIKIPRLDRFNSQTDIDRFCDEARTVAGLSHANIAAVYDIDRCADGTVFVVMQYINGPTLKELLERESLSQLCAAELMVTIAEAVHYAHRKGLTHRDLKPGNVLLDENDHPFVVDFGLAVHESKQRERVGELAGTLPYMSPEQIRGETDRMDGRSDIWSLGVMLYLMLTGRLPFGGENQDEVSDEIQHRDPRPLRQIDDIPKSLELIFRKCCAKDIGDRYQTAGDLAADLREFTEEPPRPIEPSVQAAPQPRKTWLFATGITIGVAVVFLIWQPWRNDGALPGIDKPTQPSNKPVVTIVGRGIVIKVDIDNRQLKFTAANRRVAVDVDLSVNAGNIFLNGEAVELSNIMIGDNVEVRDVLDSGRRRLEIDAFRNTGGIKTEIGAVSKEPLAVQLDVLVWQKENPKRRGVPLRHPEVLPVLNGEQVRVLAELNRPAFIYLIWIGSDGKAFPMYPWIEGDWTARPEVENPLKLVSLPEQANFGWPMEGPAGMETLVLVARESPLPKQVDLKALFDDEPLPPQVMQDSKSLVFFANGKTVTAQQDRLRAPNFFNPQRLHDPVLDAQRMIDSRLKPHFQLISAISFAKVEKE